MVIKGIRELRYILFVNGLKKRQVRAGKCRPPGQKLLCILREKNWKLVCRTERTSRIHPHLYRQVGEGR